MRRLTWMLLLLLGLVPILWVWPQRGLTARYYSNQEWSGHPFVTRVEGQIGLETAAADPAAFPQHEFSAEWVGWIRIDAGGVYTFSTRSDDGSSIEIEGQLVVDNRGRHASQKRSGTVALTPGVHQIRVRYVQAMDVYELAASWAPPGRAESIIPPHHFFVNAPSPVVVWLTSRVSGLWVLLGFALALTIAARIARSEHEISGADVRAYALKGSLAVASAVVTLLVIEGGLRLLDYLREDRRSLQARLQGSRAAGHASRRSLGLGDIVQPSAHDGVVYELKPNIHGIFMGQPLTINSRGLRDFEYAPAKEPGTFRIVGLGDSSLFGWAVGLEDSTLKVLERRLNAGASSTRFEVLNFAVPGYNTAIEAEVFVRKCLEYEPDLVILSFNTNDYDVPHFMKLPRDLSTLRWLYVFDFAYSAYQRVAGVTEREIPQFDFANRTVSFRESARLDEDPALPDEYRYMVGASGVVRALEKLASAARARGIPFVVFDVKGYPGVSPMYMPDELRDSQRELLERESRRQGFHFLNTYAYYIDYLNTHPDAQYPLVFAVSEMDGHPNPLAHAINAQALVEYLTAQQLIPTNDRQGASQ